MKRAGVAAPALMLRRSEIAALMRPADYLAAVESGFRGLANGDASAPVPMGIHADGGGFHVKGARVKLDRDYVAVKLNGNFPGNPERCGLPTIQGVILLCDAADGSLLAVMDSIEITLRRTAAASALAAQYLARKDARCLAMCGCGEQARAQLAALIEVLPLQRVLAWDVDTAKASLFARDMQAAHGIEVTAVTEVRDATLTADVIVTVTSARKPFLSRDCVRPGTFVAAVGADNPEKNELEPELMAHATVVADLIAQAEFMGDLHHAIIAGVMTPADVHAELGELVIGRKSGRTREDQIAVFDSTGVAVQDAASAARVYERAVADGVGSAISLNEK